jgi:adenine deaminase
LCIIKQLKMAGSIQGNIIDISGKKIFEGEVVFDNGKIIAVTAIKLPAGKQYSYILPGFIDSHVHIESSMLVPSEFARLAVVHGTVATISDPHEIANVCGMQGVTYMIENGKSVPFKFHFGAPSCVPATIFETAGATLGVADVELLLQKPEIKYLSEMMNFPGVLFNDTEVMQKIALAKKHQKPVDGHAPGLRGADAQKYIGAGISTDHECFTEAEAKEKLDYGMKILIREGSAAKNFEALVNLLHEHYQQMMFCSDDKHPDSLLYGHINQLCARAVAKGVDIFKVLQAACINPVKHYKMDVGLLQPGDAADFIVVKNLETFEVEQTYIDGQLVAANGQSLINAAEAPNINQFDCSPKIPADFVMPYTGQLQIWVVEALEGQLITNKLAVPPTVHNGCIVSDVQKDVLKMVVVNRYKPAKPAIGFVKNFGLKQGALASTVAHDSHNIIAVGVDDESICAAINLVIAEQGGVSAVAGQQQMVVGLPVAGLMSNKDGYEVAAAYTALDNMSKQVLGSALAAPFMTLSFMALLVIPHLKLSDLGLFDGDSFALIK